MERCNDAMEAVDDAEIDAGQLADTGAEAAPMNEAMWQNRWG